MAACKWGIDGRRSADSVVGHWNWGQTNSAATSDIHIANALMATLPVCELCVR